MMRSIYEWERRSRIPISIWNVDTVWDGSINFGLTILFSNPGTPKWLYLKERKKDRAPFEVYSHALKGNKNITHITFGHVGSDSDVDSFQSAISDLPWVTSISFKLQPTLPVIQRDIKSINNDLITFAKEIRPKLEPDSTYLFTDAGHSDMFL